MKQASLSNTTGWLAASGGFVAAYFLVSLLLSSPPALESAASGPSEKAAPFADPRPRALSDEQTLLGEPVRRAPAEAAELSLSESRALLAERTEESDDDTLGVTVFGNVKMADGGPAEGVNMMAQLENAERVSGTSDETGRYSLAPIEDGSVQLSVWKRGYRQQSRTVVLDPARPFEQVDWVLKAEPKIAIYVDTPDGTPLAEAISAAGESLRSLNVLPVATAQDPGETFELSPGSANNPNGIGQWWDDGEQAPSTGPLGFGWLILHEDPPAWVSFVVANRVMAKQFVQPGVTEVRFAIDPSDLLGMQSSLRGRLVSRETGEPVARAFVSHTDDGFGFSRQLQSDQDGRFSIESTSPDGRFLVVRAAGFATLRREVRVEPGEARDLGDVLLERGVAISGVYLGESGDAMRGLYRVGTVDANSGRTVWLERQQYGTYENGDFEHRDLPPGQHVFQAMFDHQPAGLPVLVDSTSGPRTGVEIRQSLLSPLIVETGRYEEPWPTLRVLAPSGLSISSLYLGRWEDRTKLELPPGRLRYEVELEGEIVREGQVTLPSEDARLDLRDLR